MQQTEKYQFNLIETSDTFSPDPLNENAEKTEAALAETDTRLSAASTALDQRVTVLEGHKARMAVGTYIGNGAAARTFPVGFTPKFVIIKRVENGLTWMTAENYPYKDSNGGVLVQFVENTLWIGQTVNVNGYTYHYIVFG